MSDRQDFKEAVRDAFRERWPAEKARLLIERPREGFKSRKHYKSWLNRRKFKFVGSLLAEIRGATS